MFIFMLGGMLILAASIVIPLLYFLFTDIDTFLSLILVGSALVPIVRSILYRRDLFSPINIFCFLYGLTFGVVPIFQRVGLISIDPAYASYDAVFATRASLVSIAGLLLVYVAYFESRIAKAAVRLLPLHTGSIRSHRAKVLIVIFFLVSGMMLVFFSGQTDAHSFAEKVIYTNISTFGGGHIAFFASLYLPAGFIALMALCNRQIQRRRFFIIALFLTVVLAVLSRARGQVLLFLFLILMFYNYRKKRLDAIKAAGTFFVMLVLLFAIAQFRGVQNFQVTKQNIADTFGGLFTEHQATATLLSQYVKEQAPHFYGKIFIEDTVLSLIPRKLWPTKPDLYGGIFVTDLLIPNRQLGFYYTTGVFGQSFADFGYAGILISMIFIGFTMRVVYEYFKKNREHDGVLLWYALFCFYLWAFLRGGWGFLPVMFEKTIIVIVPYLIISDVFVLRLKSGLERMKIHAVAGENEI